MSGLEIVGVLLAGMAAGSINAVVGSGTLVSFPVLLAVGLPPVTANVSNSLGLSPGNFTAAWGYRRELVGQRERLLRLGPASLLGALTGALLLLELPETAFQAIVPGLVLLGCVLVVAQPFISARVKQRAGGSQHGGIGVWLLVFLTGIYGGYFGAAQGVILVAVLGIALDEGIQRLNAAKNVLVGLANLVAGVMFIFIADPSWWHVLLVAIGSIFGGFIGASIGRRLPPWLLRGVIVVVGLIAVVELLRS